MTINKLEYGTVRLRPLEPEDIGLLYSWENEMAVWEVSNTLVPFSKYILEQYILNSQRDIYESRQLRLVIETLEGKPVGAVDLFEFEPVHQRAGVGILIHHAGERQKGYATDALLLLCSYAREILGLHQLFANITAGNEASLHLFTKCGFELCGRKKDWIKSGSGWKDELVFQQLL
ncbi:MAG: GNAT family N-acetyltransferase [Prolixibacteraceae bacterium]|nr:GNAT family N-acetyltransferase [Prolixibacteraceae bacterium]